MFSNDFELEHAAIWPHGYLSSFKGLGRLRPMGRQFSIATLLLWHCSGFLVGFLSGEVLSSGKLNQGLLEQAVRAAGKEAARQCSLSLGEC